MKSVITNNRHTVFLSYLLIAALVVPSIAAAAVTSAKGYSATKVLYANRNNTVSIRWNVLTTSDQLSTGVNVVNTLPTVNLSLATSNQANFAETLSISSDQVKSWLDNGYRAIIVRRNFANSVGLPVGGINADVRFSLSESSLTGVRERSDFAVQRMQLVFSNQTGMTIVDHNEPLQAFLNISYSGLGLLEGQWQIAEPGSTEGLPIYRILRNESRTLSQLQHTRLTSPTLPTTKPGRYLLRFCLKERNDANRINNVDPYNCSNTSVSAGYEVMPGKSRNIESIQIQPAQQSIDSNTIFEWSSVKGAVVYQLQIFKPDGTDNLHFVTGMLLPQKPQQTQLSKLVQGKLSAGHQYLWRINALNQYGGIIGQSDKALLVYNP